MFKIIEPYEHKSQQKLIKAFMRELKSHNPSLFTNLQPMKEATFVLAEDNPNDIKGGAVFLKKEITELHPTLKKWVEDVIAPQQQIWAGTVCPQIYEGLSGQSYEAFCKVFYRDLYNSLITFGVKEKISFLYLILDPSEYLSTDLLGFWPYKVEVKHRESPDGHFHGILSLTDIPVRKGLVA